MKSFGKVCGALSVLSVFLISVAFTQNASARDEICVYTKKDYEGEEFCTSRSIPNLADYELNDKISSLSVRGSAEAVLYENADYRGKSVEYSGDVSRIGGGLDDEVSSLEVVIGGATSNSADNASSTLYPASKGWQLQAYCNCRSGKRCFVRQRNGQTEVGACVLECPNGCRN